MDGVLKPSGAAPAVRLHVSAVPEDAAVQHVPTTSSAMSAKVGGVRHVPSTGTAASAMVKRRDGMSMLGSGYHKLQQARLMAVVAKVEEMEREQNLRPGLQLTSAILLLAVPVCSAFTGVGLTVGSAEGTGFFRMTPMIVGSMTLSVGLVAWICLRYGAAELRQLFTWQYLLAGLAIGGPNAMLFTSQNLAIKTISPSLFFVIKKTNLIWAAVFEALNLRLWPERMKVATIVTLLLACSGYIFKTMADEKREGGDGGSEPEAPIEGYVLAFLAAVLSALGGALDTVDANIKLGLPVDTRTYDDALSVFRHLGIKSIRLFTNNPEKTKALEPITREVVALASTPFPQNIAYLRTKRERLNHKTVLETFRLPKVQADVSKIRVGIVYTKWNSYYVDPLVQAAEAELNRTGVRRVKLAVPGACELVSGARALLRHQKPDAIVALGILIRGSSDIYDATCTAVMTGLTELNASQDVPIIHGVLMCHDEGQADERTHGPNNPARAWAETALHMASICTQIETHVAE